MAQKDLIDEKAEIWLNKPDLELSDLDENKSIKTNHLLSHRNFLNIKKWANGLLAYIRYLRKLIDIDNIIIEVFENLRSKKLSFLIDPAHPTTKVTCNGYIDEVNNINSTSDSYYQKQYVYQIEYIDMYTVEITSLTDDNFNTAAMCVFVKTIEGIQVYPVITTVGQKITINFPDEISCKYKVYVI